MFRTFRQILDLWKDAKPSSSVAIARDCSVSPVLVRQWKHRDSVPPKYWRQLQDGARRRNLPKFTLDDLLFICEGK